MRTKKYLIHGEELTITEITQKYGVSQATFYRRLKSGENIEECVSYKTKERLFPDKYEKSLEHPYPDNLIFDLLGEVKDFTYDFDYVKENFETNFEYLVMENSTLFEMRDVHVLNELYKNHKSLKRTGEQFNLSKQRIQQIKNQMLDILKKPYFADYYLLGKDFVRQKQTYYAMREKELMAELGMKKDDCKVSKTVLNTDELALVPDRKLKVEISIRRLNLNPNIEKKLLDSGINTLNQLFALKRKELRDLPGIGNRAFEEITTAVEEILGGELSYE